MTPRPDRYRCHACSFLSPHYAAMERHLNAAHRGCGRIIMYPLVPGAPS